MRVLLVSPDYPPSVGGIQLLLHRVASHLRDCDVRVVTRATGRAARTENLDGVDVRRIRGTGNHISRVAALNAAAWTQARSFDPDVVLSGHIVVSPGTRAIGRPWAQYLHASEIAARPKLTGWAVRHAGATIAVSEHTRSLALDAGAPPERVHLVHPGVDLPTTTASIREPSSRTILMVARLEDRYKGFDVVIRALPLVRSKVPNARLVIVGGGSLEQWLRNLTVSAGVEDAVHFAGHVSDGERDAWFARASVFTMPSRLPGGTSGGEGFGIVFLEASARGVPVVGPNVGGAVDAVDAGRTGLVVDPTDHIAVADALVAILQDSDLRQAMGEAGRAWSRRFAWEQAVGQVEDVLRSIASGVRRTRR